MTDFINSNNIIMYPSGYRSASIDLLAGQNSEFNLTNTKRLSEQIQNNIFSYKDEENTNDLIIYILGYYFKIKNASTNIPTGSNTYAYIKLVNKSVTIDGTTVNLLTLVNVNNNSVTLDSNDEFRGLGFSDNIPSGCYGIKVRDAEGNIVTQPFKLSSDEIRSASDSTKSIDEKIASSVTTQSLQATNGTIQNANVQKINVSDGANSNIPVNALESPTNAGLYKLISNGATNKPEWKKLYNFVSLNQDTTTIEVSGLEEKIYKYKKFNSKLPNDYSGNLIVIIEIKNTDNNLVLEQTFNYSSLNSATLNISNGLISDDDNTKPHTHFCFTNLINNSPSFEAVHIFKTDNGSGENEDDIVVDIEASSVSNNYKVSCTIFEI